jgi:hypothetical protein
MNAKDANKFKKATWQYLIDHAQPDAKGGFYIKFFIPHEGEFWTRVRAREKGYFSRNDEKQLQAESRLELKNYQRLMKWELEENKRLANKSLETSSGSFARKLLGHGTVIHATRAVSKIWSDLTGTLVTLYRQLKEALYSATTSITSGRSVTTATSTSGDMVPSSIGAWSPKWGKSSLTACLPLETVGRSKRTGFGSRHK